MKRILMLSAILLFLLLVAWETRAQTRKPTSEGYTLVIDGLYFRVDTINHKTRIYNHRKRKARNLFIQINGGKEHHLPKNGVYMAWSSSFVLTVKRKDYIKRYSI